MVIGIVVFLGIGFFNDVIGEFLYFLFVVVLVFLMISWVFVVMLVFVFGLYFYCKGIN